MSSRSLGDHGEEHLEEGGYRDEQRPQGVSCVGEVSGRPGEGEMEGRGHRGEIMIKNTPQ